MKRLRIVTLLYVLLLVCLCTVALNTQAKGKAKMPKLTENNTIFTQGKVASVRKAKGKTTITIDSRGNYWVATYNKAEMKELGKVKKGTKLNVLFYTNGTRKVTDDVMVNIHKRR